MFKAYNNHSCRGSEPQWAANHIISFKKQTVGKWI